MNAAPAADLPFRTPASLALPVIPLALPPPRPPPQSLEDANLKKEDIDEIVLVGAPVC